MTTFGSHGNTGFGLEPGQKIESSQIEVEDESKIEEECHLCYEDYTSPVSGDFRTHQRTDLPCGQGACFTCVKSTLEAAIEESKGGYSIIKSYTCPFD